MKISARVDNGYGKHEVSVKTNDIEHSLHIPPKANGDGSSVNGGELLFLAMATCYCNDIYREAANRKIKVKKVEVEVEGKFGKEGEPGKNISYIARIAADAGDKEIRELMQYVDKVAEIQNTLRVKNTVTLNKFELIK